MISTKEEFDFTELVREAQIRWLKPVEILFILQNYNNFKLSSDPPNKPQSGSLFLYDRKVLRFFRKDGHNWRKKKDGKTIREAHERLKVGNVDALHCYYAHGEDNHNFQRRIYWMLEQSYEHIVLVHYREVTEGRFNSSSLPNFSKNGSLADQTQHSALTQVQNSSDATGSREIYSSSWIHSPGTLEEVSSNLVVGNDELESGDNINKNEDCSNPVTHDGVSLTHQEIACLQQLRNQLNLEIDDSGYSEKDISSPWNASSMEMLQSNLSTSENGFSNQEILLSPLLGSKYQGQDQHIRENVKNPKNLNIDILHQNPDAYFGQCCLHQQPREILETETNSPSWEEIWELSTTSNRQNTNSSSFPKGQSNISLANPCNVTDLWSDEESVDNVFPKAERDALQVSSEKIGNGMENNKDLLFSSGDNRMIHKTCFQGQPQERKYDEIENSEYKQVYESEGHPRDGTGNLSLSSTTMLFSQECEGREPSLVTTVNFLEEGLEKFRKSDSFGWLEDQEISTDNVNLQSDYYGVLFEQPCNIGAQELAEDSSVTLAQVQRFSILEFYPDCAYSSEGSKVLIIGNFIGNPSEHTWCCMFGHIEVPAEIIREGVLSCKAPPHAPGKLSFCVTCGNREACSEIREFEYRVKPHSYGSENVPASIDANQGHEELILQVRFARMLLSERKPTSSFDITMKEGVAEFKDAILWLEAVSDDQWEQIECAVGGGGEPLAYTKEWLLQTFLKEKLCQWLWYKISDGEKGASVLNKHGQGVLHIASALGYEWAITPILNAGVGINFRDAHGWTALHWAANYGREKTVAALIAADASAGAVTDPTPKFPSGRTAADIAAASGHGGIAGYLAEASLTSHLSTLTLGENEISKASAAVEADRAVESVSNRSGIQQTAGTTEDQLSLKDSLAAVRNSAQAAARIQAAFRAHSFRKRQQNSEGVCNEYGMTQADLHGISTIQRTLRNHRDQKFNKAATCIQRKFRGWKGRKEFLTLRQHVVKIQAHFRGHQVRKKYKMLLWTVGVLDKAILRWRRKGVGLRGFKAELPEGIELDEENDDDILKVFRKQKVNLALEEAVGRVVHMIDSPDARHQYRRMLERYQQVKDEYHGQITESSSSTPSVDLSHIEDEYMSLLE